MIDVVPACIPKSFVDIEQKASVVKGLAPMMQIDIADGKFAPVKTWPYVSENDSDFTRLVSEEKGFPFWSELEYELDMLVANPEEKIEEWIKTGISSAVIHFESTKRLEDAIEKARYYDIKVGVALKPSTPTEMLTPFVEEIDFVQFMGNDKVGYNGVELDRKVLKKISAFHDEFPECIIGIDIGVNTDTAPELVDAGVTKLVSGSAIFESGDIEGMIGYFQDL